MKKGITLLLIFISIFLISGKLNAEKNYGLVENQLTIKVLNSDNHTYYLDLFTPQGDSRYMDLNQRYNKSIKELPIHRYEENGWMALHVRNKTVKGELVGVYSSNGMLHSFEGLLPKTFKIITQSKEGGINVSEKIIVTNKRATIVLDYQTGELIEQDRQLFTFLRNLMVSLSIVVAIKLLFTFIFVLEEKKGIIMIASLIQLLIYGILFGVEYLGLTNLIHYVFVSVLLLSMLLEYLGYRALSRNKNQKAIILFIAITSLFVVSVLYNRVLPMF